MSVVERLRVLDRLQHEKLPQLMRAEAGLKKAQDILTDSEGIYAEFDKYVQAAADIEEASAQLSGLKRDLARTSDQRSATTARYIELQASSALEQKALAFYSSVLDDITAEYVSELEAALNQVYTYAFQNPNKAVKLELGDRYGKKVLLLRMVNIFDGEAHEEELKDGGYSVRVVLGTVLLVYFILYNNLERIIFFDESFGGLADSTLERFFSLLRVFIDQLGFKFCLVSHESRHADYADKSYFVRGGRFSEEKTGTQEVPDEQDS